MAQFSLPFDNQDTWEDGWRKMAKHWLATGVLRNEFNELSVYADSTGMQVKVNTGAAWIQGHYYESNALETLPIATANATNPRIDRIILRGDWNDNYIQLTVLQGVPAVSPVAPAVTKNSSRWELPLAQVRVNAGVMTITAGSVTDERVIAQFETRKISDAAGKSVEAWKALTLMNNWEYNGVGTTPAYRKDDFGIVHLKGSIKLGTVTAGTQIFLLPEGYRPPEYYNKMPVYCEDSNGVIYSTGFIDISNSGGVYINVPAATTRIYFNNIRFFTY